MNFFIATIRSGDGREYYLCNFNRMLIRRQNIRNAIIFNDAEEAKTQAVKAALERETYHVYPISLGGEVMFGAES